MTDQAQVIRRNTETGEVIVSTKDKLLKDILPETGCLIGITFGCKKYKKGPGQVVEWEWANQIKIQVDIGYCTLSTLVKGLDMPSLAVRIQKWIRSQGEVYAMAFFKEYHNKTLLYSEVDTGPVADPTATSEAIELQIQQLQAQLKGLESK